MSGFETSGHAKRWLFTESGLARQRDAVCRAAGSPLSAAEEVLLVHACAEKALSVCHAQGLPPRVGDTAALFLQRLYTRTSLARRDPLVSLCACILLAAKVEEHWAPAFAERLCAHLHVDAGRVLAFEAALLAELRFDIRVFLPRRALEGLLTSEPRLAGLADEARWLLQPAAVSDALLLFTPAQVALAVLRLAAARHTDGNGQQQPPPSSPSLLRVVDYFALQTLAASDAAKHAALAAAVSKVEALIAAVVDSPPSREQIDDIDRRLKSALHQQPPAVAAPKMKEETEGVVAVDSEEMRQ